MSKKLYIGLITGILAGISIPVIINYMREEDIFSDLNEQDDHEDHDMLDRANHYLLLARNKVDEMVAEASKRSESMIEEAGEILSSAREKTAAIHFEKTEAIEEDLNKIREEIDESIENFLKKVKE